MCTQRQKNVREMFSCRPSSSSCTNHYQTGLDETSCSTHLRQIDSSGIPALGRDSEVPEVPEVPGLLAKATCTRIEAIFSNSTAGLAALRSDKIFMDLKCCCCEIE